MARRFPIVLLLVLFPAVLLFAPPLRLRLNNNADWAVTVTAADLTGAAGTDFPTDIESGAAAQELRVQNATGNWRIDVSRSSAGWHANLRIHVRRTSAGTGGTVSGGTAYQEITTTDTSFFTGTGDPRDVALQFKSDGAYASAGVPAGVYTTTVTYTVTDNL